MLNGLHYPPPCQFTMRYRTVTWCDTLRVSEGSEKSIIFIAYKVKVYGKTELYQGPEQALMYWFPSQHRVLAQLTIIIHPCQHQQRGLTVGGNKLQLVEWLRARDAGELPAQ